MLLEINPLVLPDIGLVFWNTVAFLLLLVVLGKFAWKPILKAINDREQGIEDALAKAGITASVFRGFETSRRSDKHDYLIRLNA